MDENLPMDLHPEVQWFRTTVYEDTRQSLLVSVIQHRLQQWRQMGCKKDACRKENRLTDRQSLEFIVDIRKQGWAKCLTGRDKVGSMICSKHRS